MTADGKATSLRLHEVMDAAYPGMLLAELQECRGRAIDVDGSGVVRPSTLGLQVLLSAAAARGSRTPSPSGSLTCRAHLPTPSGHWVFPTISSSIRW